MKTCPNCGYKTLVWDGYIDAYNTLYYCNRCGEYAKITATDEEIKQDEQERLERWSERDAYRREESEWHREHDDYCRRN